MKKILSFIIAIFIIILSGCNKTKLDWERQIFFNVFGNISVEVIVITDEKIIKDGLDDVWADIDDILRDLDDVFSIHHDTNIGQNETLIQKVNRNAGIAPVEVTDEVIYVLEKAIEVSEISVVDGVAQYDVTIAPLWEEWKFIEYQQTEDLAPLPTEERLGELKSLVDYKKIIIDKEASTVFLEEEGMGLDLGSIVKGYAADKIREYLLSKELTRGLINVGGNLITMGHNHKFADNKDVPWEVQITTPYRTREGSEDNKYYIGYFEDTDVTTVTSGVYERYYIVDGIKYHHILNPATGYPRESGLWSLSIITENSMVADAYSTTVFSLGLDAGLKLVEATEGMDAIAITDSKEIYVTSGLEDRFVYNENINDIGYSYKGVYKWN